MADNVTASLIVKAAPEAVFAVLADPVNHTAIDGTGWVRDVASLIHPKEFVS